MIRGLECSRRPDFRTLMGSSGTRHQDRLDAHTPHTCARVCAANMRISINSHHTFDINKSDSTCGHLESRKSVYREG